MKTLTPFLFLLVIHTGIFAQALDPIELENIEYQRLLDSMENSFNYEYFQVLLEDGMVTLNIPEGYKFLGPEQSQHVLTDLWGNPPSEVLGLLFPKETSPISENFTYAVEVTYSEDGYIDDDDADDIDYDDLLEQIQEEARDANPARIEQGYGTLDIVGWASEPFYDKANKKLHWAQELKFEGEETNTLNYNIRVLGRKGYLNMNAIGNIDVLPIFNEDIDEILASVEFNKGHRYDDFNPDIDKVAAIGIGGLIAGKLLAKAGFFVLLLKFWKVIALAAVGAFSVFKNKILGKK